MHDHDLDEVLPAEPVVVEEPLEALPVRPEKKGQSVIAWLAIGAAIGLIFFVRWWKTESAPGRTQDDRMSLLMTRVQGKYFVGVAHVLGDEGKEQLYPHVQQALNTGTVKQRLAFIVLAGELAGPEEAEKQLGILDQKLQRSGYALTPNEAALKDIVERLYRDYAEGDFTARSVTSAERNRLRSELGWIGDLALVPPGSLDTAQRQAVLHSAAVTFVAVIGVAVSAGALGLLGTVGLFIFVILLFSRRLKTGLRVDSNYGGVYAETFALYLFTFFGLEFGVSFIPGLQEWELLLAGGAALLSLLTLAWPVARGIPWKQVREDVGLYFGRKPALEPITGLGGYTMTLPLVAVALVVIVVMALVFGALKGHAGPGDEFTAPELPSHPVVFYLTGGDWWMRLQVALLACVIAPIVEETMFRGVLYRHLREATSGLGFFLSVVISATVASFVFAVIHPQGLLIVPALMALAFGFSLVREWRGTLVPGMIAHGLHNGLVLTLAITVLGN